ncbi:MAG: QueT transporter family protein [Clostridia bacterium]|nr:QueT transporter family protein [Clostridia bacterium]
MKKNANLVRYTARGAAVAALYVVLTAFSAMLGLSSGVIQLRISEALCILPIFMPEATVGLFVGCLLSNLTVSGGVIWDVIFGSIATLIGALGARALRRLPDKLAWLATLPTVIANALIVPPVLIFAYGAEDTYWFILLTVTVGEILSATVGGAALYYGVKKSKISFK